MKTIRNRVEVLIWHKELKAFLIAKWEKPDGVQYVFPGGGVESGESVEQAAIKEALEEVGVRIKDVSKIHEGPIKPIPLEDTSSQVLFIGDVTIYVFARYSDRDYSKHNCEGDAMEFDWMSPLEAGAAVNDKTSDGFHRAQAIRNAHFTGLITF